MPSKWLAVFLKILKSTVLNLVASELTILCELHVCVYLVRNDVKVECHCILVEYQHQVCAASIDFLTRNNACEAIAGCAWCSNLDVANATYVIDENSVVACVICDCYCSLRRCAVNCKCASIVGGQCCYCSHCSEHCRKKFFHYIKMFGKNYLLNALIDYLPVVPSIILYTEVTSAAVILPSPLTSPYLPL